MNLTFTLSVHYRIGVRKKNFNHVCNHVSAYKRTKAKTIDNISLYSTERVKTRLVILFTLFLQKEKKRKKNEYLKKFQQHTILTNIPQILIHCEENLVTNFSTNLHFTVLLLFEYLFSSYYTSKHL